MKNLLILSIAFLFIISCGKGGGGTNPPTIEEQILENLNIAWTFFEQAQYDSSEYYFDRVLALRTNEPRGQIGKGWSKLLVEDSDFSNIETLFESAMADENLKNDLMAGLAIVNNVQKKYGDAADYVDQLLTAVSTYVFSHKTDINYQDLLVIQAHSYFYNKQFDNAYESILELTTDYIFDPADKLSWVVDGDTYPSYEGAISAVLAKVSDQYKSF